MPQWARSQSVGRRAPSADRNSPCDSVSLPIGSHGWSPASQHISHPLGAIAQLGERLDRTQEVAGSSPASSTSTEPPADGGGLFQFGGTMKRLSHEQENFAIALTVDAATALTTDLRARLRPALSALEATPAQALPVLPPVRILLEGQPVLELTTGEALDLYFAFMELLAEGASGAAQHNHVYDATYSDDFPVWIAPESSSAASIES